ncbi:MAG TPA: RNA polymerase sigma factor SigJ [Gaiellales bacterium]|jgi:RNA polymerase sigma-70 factor (ECF subfamily)|nr:RNA polymerase sigma factor SigJ [Gaiellales bacterium]
MSDRDWQVEQFERHRPHLHAVAYRMLGSMTEADDALQEAWFRLERSDLDAVQNVPGWLTTVVSRVCLDMLRARRARREDYAGTWLPEPVVRLDEGSDPAEQAVLADAVGLALLVVLETLSPAERLAFVLHDMFGVPFDEIAPIVERSPAATRQLTSRARRRVRGAVPPEDADLTRQREVIDAFLAASRGGDFDALLEVLDPDVVFRFDGGAGSPLARPPVIGARAVAEQVLARGSRFAPLARPALVNGAAGAVVGPGPRPIAVVGFTVSRGRIVEIDLIADPEKLRAVAVAE